MKRHIEYRSPFKYDIDGKRIDLKSEIAHGFYTPKIRNDILGKNDGQIARLLKRRKKRRKNKFRNISISEVYY